MPEGIRGWLEGRDVHRCLLAEGARALHGQLTPFCGHEPRNAGIRGLPPQFPLEDVLQQLLQRVPSTLDSELDEQGLQVAAVSTFREPAVLSIEDVTICSPFPPHRRELGRCGAHFCGLNTRHYPWQLEEPFAEEWIDEHWRHHLPTRRHRFDLTGCSSLLVG